MNKGFREFSNVELQRMLEAEYEDINANFAEITIQFRDIFTIDVLIQNNSGDRTYNFNGLSDFNNYTGAYKDEDILATGLLFADIIENASMELEIK